MNSIQNLKQKAAEAGSKAFKQVKQAERKAERKIDNKLKEYSGGKNKPPNNKKNHKNNSRLERPPNHRRQRGGSNNNAGVTPIGAMTRGTRISENRFSTQGNSLLLHRREFLGEILGHTNWNARTTELITPTNVNLMRWASQISVLFETFQYIAMSWHFRTNSGMVTTTQNQGNVEMVVIYDSDDPALANVNSFMNYSGAVMGVTYKDLSLHLHPNDAMFKKMYVNHGSTDDLTSPGKFQLAVSGQPTDNAMIGYLYVDYTIRLGIPRASPETLWNTRQQTGKTMTTWAALMAGTGSHETTPLYWTGWPMCEVYKLDSGIFFYFSSEGNYDIRISLSAATNHAGVIATARDTDITAIYNWPTVGALDTTHKVANGSIPSTGTAWVAQSQLVVTKGIPNPLRAGSPSHYYIDFSAAPADTNAVFLSIHIQAIDGAFVTGAVPRLGKERVSSNQNLGALEKRILELESRASRLALRTDSPNSPPITPDTTYRDIRDQIGSNTCQSSSSSSSSSHKKNEGRLTVSSASSSAAR